MKIERIWAMPNRHTFLIPPIKQLLNEEMQGYEFWIDPFAGYNSPAQITNDLNPDIPADYHLDALEFLIMCNEMFKGKVDGVLFDPPYSFYELLRCYKGVGKTENRWGEHNAFWSKCKGEVADLLRPNGKSISFGWNSVGIGKTKGFEITRILLVCHGSMRNDTIVTVERKCQ